MQNIFRKVSKEEFFQTFWQKRPALFEKAFPDFQNPLSSDDLFELIQEEGVHSRLVFKEEVGQDDEEMECCFGPFDSEFIDERKKSKAPWTLLINEMNTLNPDIQELLKSFSFLPHWRIDDIMVSHSSKGGSVGTHVDSYDVFLFQAQGQKRWRIGKEDFDGDTIETEKGLKLVDKLKDFDEYILNPGDILYLPPGRVHEGVAIDDECMTLSIGLTAPKLEELSMMYLSDLSQAAGSKDHVLRDPDLRPKEENSAEIDPETIQNALKQLRELVINEDVFVKSFGKVLTENKRDSFDFEEEEEYGEMDDPYEELVDGQKVSINPKFRGAYINTKEELLLFANGEDYLLNDSSLSFVQSLTKGKIVEFNSELLESERDLLEDLYERKLISLN